MPLMAVNYWAVNTLDIRHRLSVFLYGWFVFYPPFRFLFLPLALFSFPPPFSLFSVFASFVVVESAPFFMFPVYLSSRPSFLSWLSSGRCIYPITTTKLFGDEWIVGQFHFKGNPERLRVWHPSETDEILEEVSTLVFIRGTSRPQNSPPKVFQDCGRTKMCVCVWASSRGRWQDVGMQFKNVENFFMFRMCTGTLHMFFSSGLFDCFGRFSLFLRLIRYAGWTIGRSIFAIIYVQSWIYFGTWRTWEICSHIFRRKGSPRPSPSMKSEILSWKTVPSMAPLTRSSIFRFFIFLFFPTVCPFLGVRW